jgi:hypothetical protein
MCDVDHMAADFRCRPWRGKALLDRLNRLIFAIGKQPLAGRCVLKQNPEDVLCRVV